MITNKIRLKAIRELEKKHGVLRARDLVDAARDRRHPLHFDGFIWDDAKAADEHRLNRARVIFSMVRTVVTVNKLRISSVAYVRDPSLPKDEQGYVAVASLRSDKDRAIEALLNETTRIQAMLERAREIASVVDLVEELNELLNGVMNLSARLRRGKANDADADQPSMSM